MARLAFMTIGVLHAVEEHPAVQEYVELGGLNFSRAEASYGFIDRSRYDVEAEATTWGAIAAPDYFVERGLADRLAQSLSLWQTLEAVYAFSYSGVHAESLSRRKKWFVHPEWPNYVVWWVDDDHIPSWHEAYAHYEQLRRVGPSPEAFDFKYPYLTDGRSTTIDRSSVRQIMQGTTGQQGRIIG